MQLSPGVEWPNASTHSPLHAWRMLLSPSKHDRGNWLLRSGQLQHNIMAVVIRT
jgi:hypothetical protein